MSVHWVLMEVRDSTESPVTRIIDGCNHVGLETHTRSSIRAASALKG